MTGCHEPDAGSSGAASEVLAIGALKAIAERGMKVPEDISITGHDDIDPAVGHGAGGWQFIEHTAF